LTILISHQPELCFAICPRRAADAFVWISGGGFSGCLRFLGLGGIDLGKQISIFPAAKIILQGNNEIWGRCVPDFLIAFVRQVISDFIIPFMDLMPSGTQR
jgi:hypothetical protein